MLGENGDFVFHEKRKKGRGIRLSRMLFALALTFFSAVTALYGGGDDVIQLGEKDFDKSASFDSIFFPYPSEPPATWLISHPPPLPYNSCAEVLRPVPCRVLRTMVRALQEFGSRVEKSW